MVASSEFRWRLIDWLVSCSDWSWSWRNIIDREVLHHQLQIASTMLPILFGGSKKMDNHDFYTTSLMFWGHKLILIHCLQNQGRRWKPWCCFSLPSQFAISTISTVLAHSLPSPPSYVLGILWFLAGIWKYQSVFRCPRKLLTRLLRIHFMCLK